MNSRSKPKKSREFTPVLFRSKSAAVQQYCNVTLCSGTTVLKCDIVAVIFTSLTESARSPSQALVPSVS